MRSPWLSAAVALAILAGAELVSAQEPCTPATLADGRAVLAATWPEGATELCFHRPGVAVADLCTQVVLTEADATPPLRDCAHQAVPSTVRWGQVFVRLDPAMAWEWQAFARGAWEPPQTELSAQRFVVPAVPVVPPPPPAPRLLLQEIRHRLDQLEEQLP